MPFSEQYFDLEVRKIINSLIESKIFPSFNLTAQILLEKFNCTLYFLTFFSIFHILNRTDDYINKLFNKYDTKVTPFNL